ncbi:hypothetical protein [Limnohabitans sp.]|uniref:hypothetical protein n=1 Tax=Limnohabitans sp. TaxID=1907725 RepID=UPI002897AB7C|nr:hypothetical protein [Limnohabitans sp.]
MKIFKWTAVILFGGFFLSAMFSGLGQGLSDGSYAKSKAISDTKQLEEKLKKDLFKNRMEKFPLAIDYSWRLGGFGNILIISGEIKNHPNGVIWADPTIYCETFGGSGRKISEVKKTVYQVVPVGGALNIKDFSLGFVNSQTQTARCNVNGRAVEP